MNQASSDQELFRHAERCFTEADDRFVEAIRSMSNASDLAVLVDRWRVDNRSWARLQIESYLTQPLDREGHEVVVKRLFKQAEERADHGPMASFLVAFDRLVRRRRRTRHFYDRRTGRSWQEQRLIAPANVLAGEPSREYRNPRTGEVIRVSQYAAVGDQLFSYRTRFYLRRRAWRYFRYLAYSDPQSYRQHVTTALARYSDSDLSAGEHVLECWGLVHACFAESSAIEFGATRIRLTPGSSLRQLSPAPYRAFIWHEQEAVVELMLLIGQAESQLVRQWAVELFRQQHMSHLQQISVEQLLQLFAHYDDAVVQFASELLPQLPQAAELTVGQWLQLLEVPQPAALTAICEALRQHLLADELTFGQCLDLACASATPVSRLGFEFVQSQWAGDAIQQKELVRLAQARCEATGGTIASWALAILGTGESYQRDHCLEFLDSRNLAVREAAWQWLVDASPGYADPVLFTRLLETPYHDIRFHLIEDLTRRADSPQADQHDLTPVWTAVILGVHRGSRMKRHAIGQLADCVAADPQRAEALLPVLSVALRSIRAPEMRAALAAVVSLVERRPELTDEVERLLPELELAPSE